MNVSYTHWHNTQQTAVHFSGTVEELPLLQRLANEYNALHAAHGTGIKERVRTETNEACVSAFVDAIVNPPAGAELLSFED